MHRATRRQLLGVLTLLAVGIVGTVVLTPARVIEGLEGLADSPMVFGLAIAGLYLVRSLFLWPVTLVSVLLGYLYDPLLAVPVALAGAALTGVPPFLLARHAIGDQGLFGAIGEAGSRVTGHVGALRGIVVSRLVPIPTDAVSYAAGLSEVSLAAFVVGTGLGELPWTLLAVAAGNSMRTLSVEGFTVDPGVVVGLLCLGVILLAGPLYRLRGTLDVTS